MTNNIQTLYQQAIRFAAEWHGDQKIPGSGIPYAVHLGNVCMEILFAARVTDSFDLPLAVQVALLHDVLEDTPARDRQRKPFLMSNRYGQEPDLRLGRRATTGKNYAR